MVARQDAPVNEVALARCLHRAVGGPAALSAIDDPTAAREAVLAALAAQQPDPSAARRVASGDLTPLERRVVRTVTNRGAAVRSRVRQRRELTRLREELQRKDARLRRLEATLRALSASSVLPILPAQQRRPSQTPSSSLDGASHPPSGDAPMDQHQFASLIDQLISPKSWLNAACLHYTLTHVVNYCKWWKLLANVVRSF